MPGAYTIDPARSLVLSRGWGVLTSAELLRHVRSLAADPRFKSHFRQLADLREVTEIRVTAAAIREVAGLNPFGSGARRALAVGSDVVFGMARMYQILTDQSPDEFEVFRDLDRALEWLGVHESKPDILRALGEAPELHGTD